MNRTIYIDNLKEEQMNRFAKLDIEVLTPKEVLNTDLKDSDALMVLCELNVNEEGNKVNRSDFYGVKLVQELRRNSFMGKVLFVSFVKEQYIVDNQLGEIIKSIGHSFLRLPSSATEWKNELKTVLKLDKLSHYDIVNHFSGENAIVGEKIHAIESKIVLKNEISDEDKNACIQIIKSTYAAKQKNVENVVEEFKKINNGKSAIQFVKDKCYDLFPKKDETVKEKLKPEWSKWKVLWLDDEETEESRLKLELESRGKLKVEIVKTYQEAIDVWNEDQRTTQEICVVIADYRLNDTNGACKKKQGYHFLQYIADKNIGIGLIAYSGLTRRFLFESFKHYGVQVNIFSKIDFNQENQSNIEYLADQIIQLGDNHWMLRNNQPQGSEWEKIGPFYFVFKESINYYSFEQILSKRVRQNLDVFIKSFNKCSDVKELWELTFTDSFNVRNGKFPDHNKGKLKNKIEIVKEILTIRRFAVGLFAFLKSNINKNTQLNEGNYLDYLKFVIYNSDKLKSSPIQWDWNFDKFIKNLKANSSLKNVVSKPALTFDSSWPYGLLPEEYAWLECDSGLGVTYLLDNKNYWSKIESLRKIFKENFTKSTFLQSVLEEGKISFDKKNVYFNDDYEPFFRSVDEIKGVIKVIYNILNNKESDYETQLTDFIQLLRDILIEIEKEEKIQSNINSILTFIKTLKAITKKLPKEIRFIDEEYSYAFAPWEFRVSRSNRYKISHKARLNEIKENCLKSISDTNLISKYQNKKSLPYFEIFTNKDKVDSQGINLIIYNAIISSNIHRNNVIKEIYAKIEPANGSSSIDVAERVKAKKASSNPSNSDYLLPNDIMEKLKGQLQLKENKISELSPKYFSYDTIKDRLEDGTYKHIVMFSYNEKEYPQIEGFTNNISNEEGMAVLVYK